jgi:DNA helicase MCM8
MIINFVYNRFVRMASSLLSRFDLIFILLDRADEDRDRRISEHIMGVTGRRFGHEAVIDQNSNRDSSIQTLSQRLRSECSAIESNGIPAINPAELRSYIEYARQTVFPKLSPPAAKVLQKMYLTMRSRSGTTEDSTSGDIPVTTRHLESLIRLSQARARMELRDEVMHM